MPLALFGLDGGVGLFVNLLILFLVVVYLALIYWTYLDARRRIEDPVLIACATAASVFPFLGTVVYTILRPPEFLEDREERELELRAAELRAAAADRAVVSALRVPDRAQLPALPELRAAAAQPVPQVPASRSTRSGASAPTARPRSASRSERPRSARDAAPTGRARSAPLVSARPLVHHAPPPLPLRPPPLPPPTARAVARMAGGRSPAPQRPSGSSRSRRVPFGRPNSGRHIALLTRPYVEPIVFATSRAVPVSAAPGKP